MAMAMAGHTDTRNLRYVAGDICTVFLSARIALVNRAREEDYNSNSNSRRRPSRSVRLLLSIINSVALLLRVNRRLNY